MMRWPQRGHTIQRRSGSDGFTLVELMIAIAFLVVALAGLLSAFLSLSALNEYSRNVTWATNDATRVLEQMRQQNTGGSCFTPSAAAPSGSATWDAWLTNVAGGKSIQPNPSTEELATVTSSGTDPLTVSVMVCWRQRSRVVGECTWSGSALSTSDLDGDGTLESPVMLTTIMTCRR